jgi:hypothetical protein
MHIIQCISQNEYIAIHCMQCIEYIAWSTIHRILYGLHSIYILKYIESNLLNPIEKDK